MYPSFDEIYNMYARPRSAAINDPSTLEEIDIGKLRERDQDIKSVQYAVVRGCGQFPVDMLRYDYAAPVNFKIIRDDYGRIKTELIEGHICNDLGLVIGGTVSKGMIGGWTEARWESFGWSCKPLNTLKFKKNE